MGRAHLMMPLSTTLMLVVTFLLSVHIANSQNTSTDVTTVTSSYNASESNDTTETSSPNASESTATNDTSVTPSYNTSDSSGTNDTSVTSSPNASESPGTNYNTETSSYNASESPGTNYNTVTSSYNASESPGTNYTTVTSSYNASESTGNNITTVTSSYNASESANTNDTPETFSYNASESTATNDTTVTSSYNASESAGTNNTPDTPSYNASESADNNNTPETSSSNASESTGNNNTTVMSSYNASESAGTSDTPGTDNITVTSSYKTSDSTGTNDTSVTSSYITEEITSTGDSTIASTNTPGNFGNTTQTSGSNSTDDTVTPTDSTEFTNSSTAETEISTTASIASSSQAQTNATITTATIPTTTVIPFGGSCSPGVENCSSNFVCDNTTKTCVCLTDHYHNISTQSCSSKKDQGVDCGSNSECINNLTCVVNKCDCSEGYYYSSSGFCEAKKHQGGDCGSNSECIYNLTCVSNKCGCSEGYYYNSSGFCEAKLEHGVECQIGQSSDQCKVTNTVCTFYLPSSPARCLCVSGFYWTDNRSCNPKSNLNIVATVADSDRKTRSITFHWTDSSQRNNVTYSIKRDGSNSMDANKTGVTVGGLDPGTSYIFSVVTSLPADGNYPLIEETQAQSEVWTFPDPPGEVTTGGVKRIDNTTYEVTFEQSSGKVNQYKMNVSLARNFTEEQSSTSPVLYFKKLQPATTYNYTLWSENLHEDKSVPVTGHFTTDAEASGPVDDLKSTGVQPNAANVTWKPPQDPGGSIIGYLVDVALQDNVQCFYYFNITSCHQCSQAPPNIGVPPCNLTDANFNVSDKLYMELLNLKPYKNYTITVQARNEKGLGQPKPLPFQTSTSVPYNISDLTVNSVRNESSLKVDLIITWTPGEQTGPTSYYISAQGHNYNQNISPLTVTVTGYNNTSTVIYDVLAYWNYTVSVLAHTDQGNSSEMSTFYRTVETNPGPIKNLNVSQDSTIANIVTLTFECPEITSRNGIIEQFMITQTLLNPQGNEEKEKTYNYTYSASLGGESCSSGYRVNNDRSVIVERNYSITVITVNNKYTGSVNNTWPNFYVQPQVPQPAMLKDLLNVTSLVKQQESSNEQTKINTDVCSTCLTDTRWGRVVSVGLIVCGSTDCAKTGRKKRATAQEFTQLPTWAAAKKNGFNVAYRTTPNNWRIPPVSGNNYSPFVVGENTSCADANTADYCNGPVPAGREFIFSVIMCTTAGCTTYSEPGIFKTSTPPDESSNVGAIVGGVLGGLALVAVIGVIIFLARNYKKKNQNHSRPPIENETKGKEIIKKRPVRMRDFNDHVTKFHKDSNLLFQDEFENIRNTSETFNNTCDEAKREQNRVKNRWADILPYDHSRVKLNISSDDDDTNDFINANYIPGYSSVREYIATQGPLYSTVPDFWKMIWEQKSKVIVMLSDLTESGKNGIPQRKVDLYWPENLNEPISYGTVVVEMTNFSQMNKYIIRNFRLIKGEEIRKVTHFFLPGWPDYSADVSFDAVLGFVKAVRQEITPESQGPIVVHCSAGVGRSGTFIALDYFTQFVEQHGMDDFIDVFEFVLRMRKNRTRMVQVETQYIFIYDGINKLIQTKIKSEEEKLYENVNPANGIYENLKQQEENIYANNTAIKDDKYVYNNEAFEPDFAHSQKSDKPTTEL